MVTKKEIEKYLKEKAVLKNFWISGLKLGLSNRNYIITADRKKYVLRANKKKPPMFPDNLKNEHQVLKYFEKENINFVPRSVFFDPKENIHIISYIAGRHIWFKNLSRDNLRQAIKKKYKINSLAKNYIKYLRSRRINIDPPRDEPARLKRSIGRKINSIKNKYPLPGTVRWAKEKLNQDLGDVSLSKKNIFLNHGDPASNLLLNNGRVYIIDWEFVKLSYDPGLAHMFTHGNMDIEKEDGVIEYYAGVSGLDHAKLKRDTRYLHKLLLLLEILKICKKYSDYYIALQKEKNEDIKNIRGLMKKYKDIITA